MKTYILKILPIMMALVVTSCDTKQKSSNNPSKPDETSNISESNIPSDSPSLHEHEFATTWSHDDEYHWHEALCGHHEAETKEKHSFNDWTYDKANAKREKTCSICAYKVSEDINVYEVKWMNEGTLLDEETYIEDEVPSYKGETPVKAKDADFNTYEFSGWDKTPSPIKANTTFNAQFRKIDHVHSEGRTERVEVSEPNCTENGSYQIVTYCAECQKEYKRDTFDIPALGHDLVQVAAKDATCTEAGYNAYEYCSRCDYTTKIDIPATGHIHLKTRIENEVAPDCLGAGYHDVVTYCEDDNVIISTERVIDPALGHALQHVDAKAPTCTEKGHNAYDYCTREGCNYSTKEDIPALGHDKVLNETTLEYTCSRCGESGRNYEATVTLEPLHVGDIYNKHAAVVSWKNDDHALSFVYIMYKIEGSYITPNVSGTYEIPSAYLGKDVEAHVYIGVNDATNLVDIDGSLDNCTLVYNGTSYPCVGSASGNQQSPEGVTYRNYYHFGFNCGQVLPDTREYTVTWKNYDGTILETDTVLHGDMPSYDGETPTKPADAENTYAFLSWDKELAPVTEDVTYTAVFGSSAITYYNITFIVRGESHVVVCAEMNTPSYAAPITYQQDGKTYAFQGWDKEVVPATEEATYTAVYTESLYDYELNAEGTGYIIKTFVNPNYEGDVVLPSSFNGLPVTELRESLFYNCPNLGTVTIPNSVTTIGGNCFEGSKVKKVIFGSGADIPSYCCYNCSQLTEIVLPEGITKINYNAFYRTGLSGLLYLPDSVESVNSDAFAYTNIEVVRFGANFKTLNYTAFSSCPKLYEGVNESTKVANQYIKNMMGVNVLAVVSSMDERGSVGVDEDGVKYYDNKALSMMIAIGYEGTSENLVLNDRYTEIKASAFNGDTVLKNVDLGKVSTIGQYAFSGSAIESVKLSPNLTELGQIFRDCYNLTSVDRNGAHIKYVRGLTFAGCTSLTSLDLGDEVLEYGQFLASSGVTSFTLSSVCRAVDLSDAKLNTIAVAEGNTNFKVVNNALYTYDGSKLCYAAYSGNSNFVIADGTQIVGQYTFHRALNIFNSITIPSSVTKIEKYAFGEVEGLTAVNYLGTMEQFNAITKDSYAFYNCPVSVVTCNDGTVTIA